MVILPFQGKLYAVGAIANDCPLPRPGSPSSTPVLSVSSDGGKTWGQSTLKGSVESGSATNLPLSGFTIGGQIFILWNYEGISSSKDGIYWGPIVRSGCQGGLGSSLMGVMKGGKLIVQCDNQVIVSVDSGATWNKLSPTGSYAWCTYGTEAILCADQQKHPFGPWQFHRTRDVGVTWENIDTPLGGQLIHRFVASANAFFVDLVPYPPLAIPNDPNLMYSTDEGVSWHFTYLPHAGEIFASPSDTRLWMVPQSSGDVSFSLFQSDNQGQSWSGANAGLPLPTDALKGPFLSWPYVNANWLEIKEVPHPGINSNILWIWPLGQQL
jgi:hypothetical protein